MNAETRSGFGMITQDLGEPILYDGNLVGPRLLAKPGDYTQNPEQGLLSPHSIAWNGNCGNQAITLIDPFTGRGFECNRDVTSTMALDWQSRFPTRTSTTACVDFSVALLFSGYPLQPCHSAGDHVIRFDGDQTQLRSADRRQRTLRCLR